MQVISLIFGLIALLFMFIGLIPFLGWTNWINIPVAFVGLILGAIGLSAAKKGKTIGIIGIILCVIAILFGALKLQACGGFL